MSRWFLISFLFTLPAMAQVGTVLGVPNSLTPSCTNTYYISQSAGADSNNGTAKGTPWQHSPYMSTFTGSYTHHAGDCEIFKGGDTWGAADLGVGLHTSGSGFGTSILYDYYGVDVTWFTGGSWVRPIFDAQASTNIGNLVSPVAADGGSGSYVTFDSLELKGVLVNGGGAYESVYIPGNHDVMLNNLNIHGWTGSLNAGMGNQPGNYWGGVGNNNPVNDTNVTFQNGLIHNETGCMTATITHASRTSGVATITLSGTVPANWVASGNTKIWVTGTTDGGSGTNFNIDTGGVTTTSTTNSGNATFTYKDPGNDVSIFVTSGTVYAECGIAVQFIRNVSNSEFYAVSTFMLDGGGSVHDNYIHDNPGIYCNCGSTNNMSINGWDGTSGSPTTPSYIYRNRFVNSNLGTAYFPSLGAYAAGGATVTGYLFDNVMVWRNGHPSNFATNLDPFPGCGTLATCNFFIYNNTFALDSSDGSGCGQTTARGGGLSINNITLINNHCIHTGGSGFAYSPTGTFTNTTNLIETNANATTAGYVFQSTSSTLNFAPTSSTCNGNPGNTFCTIANGTDETSACSGSPLSPYLCEDRNNIARPNGSAWDIGAYQASGPATPVFSPNGGTFTANPSVTITCGSGATCCYTTNGVTPTAGTPGTCDQNTYSTPITIPSTLTLKAIGTEVGFTNSSVQSALFTMIPLIAPSSLAFGNQTVNTTSSGQVITFTNNTGATITFTSVALTTGTQFAISANTCTGTLTNTSSCTTTITFTPTTAGAKSDTLTYTDSDASSPQTVSLSGTGVAGGGGNAVTLTRGVTMTQGTTVVQ